MLRPRGVLLGLLLSLTCPAVWAQVWTSSGPYFRDVRALAVDPSDPATLYAGTWGGGVFKSMDSGATWVAATTGMTTYASVGALAIDPSNPATLYAGTDGGIFKSTDSAGTWVDASTGLTSQQALVLAISPSSPSTLYVGTYGGVFRSTNGGGTWVAVNTGLADLFITALVIDPSTPATLYAGTIYGIFKSTDSGDTWAAANSGLMDLNIAALVIDPSTPSTLYTEGGFNGVFKSTDSAGTWVAANTGLTSYDSAVMVISPSSPSTLYIGTGSGGVFTSTNAGGNWVDTMDLPNHARALAVDPSNPATLYAGTVHGIFKSTDSAGTWALANTGLTLDIRALALDPLTPATVYAGAWSGGVFKSTDSGSTWATTGLLNTLVFAVAIDPTTPSTLYAGGYIGFFKSTDSGGTWVAATTGMTSANVWALAIDPSNPATLYAGTYEGGIFKSTDSAGTWAPTNAGSTPDIRALALDPLTPATLYAGTISGVFKSTDSGGSWTAASTGLTELYVDALAIDSSAPATLYAGTLGGGVFKSTDSGGTWVPANTGLASGYVRALAIDPMNPATLYAGTLDGVFNSTDSGDTWAAANSGLTTLDVSAVALNAAPPGVLYAGTVGGVFRRTPLGPGTDPTISSLSPSTVAGSTFILTVNGTNFEPTGAVVEIYQPSGTFLGNGVVSSRGPTQIVTTQTLGGAAPGNYGVKVKNPDGTRSAQASLLLIDEVQVFPAAGSVGTSFTYTGRGFTSPHGVSSHLQRPDSSEFPVLQIPTPSGGSFTHVINSTTFVPGTYTVWAVDNNTGIASAHTTFLVGAPGACLLTCTAATRNGLVGESLGFVGTATAANCSGSPTYAWSFGDGHSSSERAPSHAYASPGSYGWSLTTSAGGQTCTKSGSSGISTGPSQLTFAAIGSTQSQGTLFPVTITARDANGNPVGYTGRLSLSSDMPLSLRNVDMVGGVWSGQIATLGCGAGVALHAAAGPVLGTSGTFAVTNGAGCLVDMQGRVVDESGQPVSGATVSAALVSADAAMADALVAGDPSTTTGADGRFKISSVPAGRQQLSLNCGGIASAYSVTAFGGTTGASFQNYMCKQPVSGKIPVVLVPGIMGSTQKTLVYLYPDPGRKLPAGRGDLKPWDGMGSGLLGETGWSEVRQELRSRGYTDRDIFECPWDWRVDMGQAVQLYLKPCIAEAKQASGQSQVDVVAHSMGGLLVRHYIQYATTGIPDVRRLALVGTPHLGSPLPFYLLEGGDPRRSDAKGVSSAQSFGMSDVYTVVSLGQESHLVGSPECALDNAQSQLRPACRRVLKESLYPLLPTMRQLLPTYSYLFDESGRVTLPGPRSDALDRLNTEDTAFNRLKQGPQVMSFIGAGKTEGATLNKIKTAGAAGPYENRSPLDGGAVWGLGDETVPYASGTYLFSKGVGTLAGLKAGKHAELVNVFKAEIANFISGSTPDARAADVASPHDAPAATLAVTVEGGAHAYLLQDATGDAAGQDPGTGDVLLDIAGSDVAADSSGTGLTLSGVAPGTYTLTLSSDSDEDLHVILSYADASVAQQDRLHVFGHAGQSRSLAITVSDTAADRVVVTGDPEPPIDLEASPVAGAGGLTTLLEWSPVAGVGDYRVYTRVDGEPFYQPLALVSQASYDTGLPWSGGSGTARFFVVAAVTFGNAESILSDEVSDVDQDGDGLSDAEETAAGTDPTLSDTDGDGLSDADERALGTDALSVDTDGDGVSDVTERDAGTNPLDPGSLSGVPALGISGASVTEGNSGTTSGVFTVTLSAPSANQVSVSYATKDGTASAGSDYVAAAGALVFAPGETSNTVSVTVMGDATLESNEGFTVLLTNAKNATIHDGDAQGTILDDDRSGVKHVQAAWHPFFAVNSLETPYMGDFNGDGLADIITFTRQNPSAVGDVYVALSDGAKFGDNTKWHDWFAITTNETVVIGDFDGDGKDDVATWLGKASRQVYVARSLGTGMTPESVWLNSIGTDPTDVLMAGDANGDGKKDLICFARSQGKVYVALSDGTQFGAPTVWHNFFAVSTYERPRVADVNGDGRADIVTFATNSPTAFGDVYVAVSDGTRFVDGNGAPNSSDKWHDFFAIQPTEQVRVGDLNEDGKDDFFTFLPPPFAQCYTVLSQGTSMAANVLWPEAVGPDTKDVPFVGDVNGDGKTDIILFAQGEGKVYVSLTP